MEDKPITIIDDSDPDSIVNLISPTLKKKVIELYTKHPEYLDMSEFELRVVCQPNEKTETIRILFWEEYHRAMRSGTKMRVSNIYHGAVSVGNFYTQVFNVPERLAWILCPVQEHMVTLKIGMDAAKENITKILKMKIFDEQGQLLSKEAQVFLKTYEMVTNRVLGSVVQRVDQRTQYIPSDGGGSDIQNKVEKLQEKLAIEPQLGALPPAEEE